MGSPSFRCPFSWVGDCPRSGGITLAAYARSSVARIRQPAERSEDHPQLDHFQGMYTTGHANGPSLGSIRQ